VPASGEDLQTVKGFHQFRRPALIIAQPLSLGTLDFPLR
jgi:hypothetical protein